MMVSGSFNAKKERSRTSLMSCRLHLTSLFNWWCLVPINSLKIGWVESPLYFCAASEEMTRDVANQYIEAPHLALFPSTNSSSMPWGVRKYKNFRQRCRRQTFPIFVVCWQFFPYGDCHVPRAHFTQVEKGVMMGIHDVFQADEEDGDDPISLKKLKKLEGQFALLKEILGFDFDGDSKTMVLCKPKRELLLAILHKWICVFERGPRGVTFNEFESSFSFLSNA